MVKKLVMVTALLGCAPELDDRVALVENPRLLAVRATPAEVKPGETVTLEALFVDANGTRTDSLRWSLCLDRKPLAESGTIASSCLVSGTEVSPAAATIPSDACRNFGPERPEPKPGEPSGRPSDPDASGGYYQPFRVDAPAATAFAEVRIRCGLAGATQEQTVEFERRGKPNENPKITAVELPATVARGARVPISVLWAATETYPYFDPAMRTIVDRREIMRVSWYANAGTFASERTGRGDTELVLQSDNTWTAPNDARDVTLWIVLRDDRGGVDYRAVPVKVL